VSVLLLFLEVGMRKNDRVRNAADAPFKIAGV